MSLEALQARLDILGIRDVKVFWSDTSQSREILEKELCTIISMHLDGHSVPLPPLDVLLSLR